MRQRKTNMKKNLIVIVLVMAMIIFVSYVHATSEDNSATYTKAYFCAGVTEVWGNADCILLENKDKDGNIIYGLIDAGRKLTTQNETSTVVKDFLVNHNVTKLEFVLITHMHDDHYGDIATVLNSYEVDTLYIKDFDSTYSPNGRQDGYETIIKMAVNKGIKVVGVGYDTLSNREFCPKATTSFFEFMQGLTADQQSKFTAFNEENTEFTFGSAKMKFYNWEIHDTEGNVWIPGVSQTTRQIASNENNNSLVLKLTQGTQIGVFTGDLNNLDGDEDRIKDGIGDIDFLKLGHHGSSNSNTINFLETLKPQCAAITTNVGWRIYTNNKLASRK